MIVLYGISVKRFTGLRFCHVKLQAFDITVGLAFMRIISGKARGTKLVALKGASLRPTLDRVKESLFNRIGPLLEGENRLNAAGLPGR